MSKPWLHTKYQKEQLERMDVAMAKMLEEGIPMISTPFRITWEARARLQASMGYKLPREVFAVFKIYGLSPGTLTLWLDSERGWMTEARERPGAPPIYKAVSDEVAMAILKGELTPELEASLMAPVEYYGE